MKLSGKHGDVYVIGADGEHKKVAQATEWSLTVRTRASAPAPRPSNEEMLDAIAKMTVRDLTRLRYLLALLLIRRMAESGDL